MPKVQGHQLGGHCTPLAPTAGGAAEELPRERREVVPKPETVNPGGAANERSEVALPRLFFFGGTASFLCPCESNHLQQLTPDLKKKRKEGKEEKREERYTRPGTAARGKCECELFRIEIPVPTTRQGYSEQSASDTLMVNFCCFIVSNKMCIILFSV